MELTIDNLEYIIYVAKKYCYPNKQHFKEISETEDGIASIRDTEEMAVSIAIPQFKQRYPILEEEFKEAYDRYISDEDIQNTLSIYKLDADKFWLLFLFITDFTNSCFTYSLHMDKLTVRETAKRMIRLINQEKASNYSLTLSCEGEKISSDNPLLIGLFEDFCAKLVDNSDDFLDTKHYKGLKVEEDKVKTKKMRFFVELFRYFLYDHVEVRQPSKMSFIGKFLYLAKIEEKESYYNGYSPALITRRNKFLIKQYGTIFMNGKEFIKEPVNVGKDIADTIKKCKDYDPISLSNYFCE